MLKISLNDEALEQVNGGQSPSGNGIKQGSLGYHVTDDKGHSQYFNTLDEALDYVKKHQS